MYTSVLFKILNTFHVLQDILSTFWDASSAGQRGTLLQLKNAFGHKNACKTAMNDFGHCEDLLKFIGHGNNTY